MSKIRVGINGFGRIGRCVLKQLIPDSRFEVVGINDLADNDDLGESPNEALAEACASGPLRGVLRVSEGSLVSRDILGDPHSSIVDAESTMVLRDNVVKILSWYDNEWGYSARLVDMAHLIGA